MVKKVWEKYFFFIIFLIVKIEDIDKIIGLILGVDDYIIKLFNLLEVVVCIKI